MNDRQGERHSFDMPRAPRLAFLLIVASLAIAAGGCGSGGPGSGADAVTDQASSPQAVGVSSAKAAATKADAPTAGESAQTQRALPRKIIYTGQVSLACEDLDRALNGLEKAVRSVGGYVGDANRSGERDAVRTATTTIRVPSDRFDTFLKALPGLGEFESSTRTAQDVSEEFYDAAARLTNKRVEEARLIDLLKRVAGNLDQILRVEGELSRIRGEIEGRLRFLANQTDLSTVMVNLREVKNFVPEGPPTLRTRIARTFSGSVEALAEFGAAILLFLVGAAPWLLPLGALALVGRLVLRRSRRKPPIVHEIPRD